MWDEWIEELNNQSLTGANIILKGDSDTNDVVGQLLSSVASTSTSGPGDEWQVLRTFITEFAGSFRVMVEAQKNEVSGATSDTGWRLKNEVGSVVHTQDLSSTTYAEYFSGEETVSDAGETWTIEGRSLNDGAANISETDIRDIEVMARLDLAQIT
jgi:hypothetical protein